MSHVRLCDAGDAAVLCELAATIDTAVNSRAIAIARAVNAAGIPGVRDAVPTYGAVGVYFDPATTDRARVRSVIASAEASGLVVEGGHNHEVPVLYGGEHGPDLPEVASFGRVTERQAVRLHSDASYRVFMLGFLPGFPYMGIVDARIAAPRRPSPRLRVAAGSIGIAGRQTGIYPRTSPGGWQIIGRTPLELFDVARTPPALFAPGDTVRFVPTREADFAAAAAARVHAAAPGVGRIVTVVRPGLFTTIQDTGRWGYQSLGVSVAGPLDSFAHRLANALVGNEAHAATLEVTLAGPELRFEHDVRLALAGADLGATLDGALLVPGQTAAARASSVLRFGARRSGARCYLAFDGGIAVPPVLGSRATHVRSGLGGLQGRSLAAGDRIPLGEPHDSAAGRPRVQVEPRASQLRVLPGPNGGSFPQRSLEVLLRTRWTVSPQSDRMGYRLSGGRIDPAADGMISTATFSGAIQVPPSGEPILLLADRQTTGGYPQLATVISADQDAAGQLAPGDSIEFAACSAREALAALDEREQALRALVASGFSRTR
jgi:KipI family sensor histidine kinase inhibitor